MVGMCGRVVNFPNVPVAEKLYFYHLFHRKKYKHLYFCKNCALNFETAKPAKACTRCHHSEVAELFPKDFMKSDSQALKEWIGNMRKSPAVRKYKTPKMPRAKMPAIKMPALKAPGIDSYRKVKIRFHYMFAKQGEELPTK